MTLGEKIKRLRTEKGITQETLAEEINVSRSAIAKWETNSGVPEVSNLIMISRIFNVSVDELVDDTRTIGKTDVKTEKKSDCFEYAGNFYDIELNGWNDGVEDVLIINEDEDFLFYQKPLKRKNVFGLIGKKYITSLKASEPSDIAQKDIKIIDKHYFCSKHVFVELAVKEGFIKGFFDFRNDDYQDVVIQSFTDSRVLLKFGKEVDINTISKIEELEVVGLPPKANT